MQFGGVSRGIGWFNKLLERFEEWKDGGARVAGTTSFDE